MSTAADLAKFFGQLAPSASTSVLSAASRREMRGPRWRDAYSTLERSYGPGTISGTLDGWDWFGRGGAFLGYLTRTAVVPARDLAVSMLTNAVDGLSQPWLDGAPRILKAYQAAGAPRGDAAGWTGRWWGVWGALDLVPMGGKVLLAVPGLLNPVEKVTELEITGADEARIVQAGAFASYAEPVRRIRDPTGTIIGLRVAGATLPGEASLAAEVRARYGVADS